MKRIIPLFASLVLLITQYSCSNFSEMDNTVDISPLVVTASFGDSPDTKTERTEAGKILWLPGDAISLYYSSGEGGGSRFVSTNTSPTGKAYFSGNIGVITGGSDDVAMEEKYFWGLYPYDAGSYCDGSYVYTSLPSKQIGVEGTFADDTFISLGRSKGLDICFYNVCAGFAFSLTRDDVVEVVFSGNNNENLYGDLKVGFDENDRPKVEELSNGGKTITLTAPDGECFKSGVLYYAVSVPQTFSKGFSMKMSTGSQAAIFEYSNPYTLSRSSFVRKKNADGGLEFYDIVSFDDASFKSYCVGLYDTDGDGELNMEEASSITEIHINSNDLNVRSLKGIESMPNLEVLECTGEWMDTRDNPEDLGYDNYYIGHYKNNWDDYYGPIGVLEYVDVSSNTELRELYLWNNSALGEKMGSIDLSNNTKLECLDLGMTYMIYPDLTACKNTLRSMNITHGRGTIPSDLGSFTKLEHINLDWPQEGSESDPISLDLSNLTQLIALNIDIHPINSLILSPECYTSIKHLGLWGSSLTEFDPSLYPNLENLELNGNPITSLDLSDNTSLEFCEFGAMRLEYIDLSSQTKAVYISIGSNTNLTNDRVVFPDAPDLEQLIVDNTPISSLDLTRYPKLKRLFTNWSAITELDISSNLELTDINVYSNTLEKLIMSKNQQIEGINVNRDPELIHPNTVIEYSNSEPVIDDDV